MHPLKSASWIGDPRFIPYAPIDYLAKELPEATPPTHDPTLQHHHMLFRNVFSLDALDAPILLHISADDYYKLYINGHFIGQGPAPGYPFQYQYNTYDITHTLQIGDNIIAVHVYYQGLVNRVWNSGDYRQGMIASVQQGDRTLLVSDTAWRTLLPDAWGYSHITGYQTQFMESIDARLLPDGWQEFDFDDRSWSSAVVHPHQDHQFQPQALPPVHVETIHPQSVVQRDDSTLFIDVGQEVVGQITLDAIGPAGQALEIRLGEELNDDGTVRYQMRCNCDYRQYWILSGTMDHVAFYDYLAFRYVEIHLPLDTDIANIAIQIRHAAMNDDVYTMQSSDPSLDQIFAICKNAVKFGTQEAYLDCPTREKGQYLGDGTITAHAQLLLSGDPTLYRKMLYDFAASCRICPGMMAVAPGSFMQEIADYSCQYPQQLDTYYRYTGDCDALETLFPIAEGIEKCFDRYARKDGLIHRVTDKWNLVDWPKNLRDDYDFDDNKPIGDCVHAVMNAFYYGLKLYMNRLRSHLGLPLHDLNALKGAFQSAFYDPQKKLCMDSIGSTHTSLHANALALYYDLLPAEATENVVQLIQSKGLCCGVYMAYFVLKALARVNAHGVLYDLMMDDMAWKNMLHEGATTCFEAWGKDQKWNTSLCHPWASAPIILIVEDIAGLSPAQPGWTDIAFDPHIPSLLDDFHLQLQLPTYQISVTAHKGHATLMKTDNKSS